MKSKDLNKNFVQLHVHSEYSILDGYGKPSQWAERAAEMGFEHIGLTDHSNADGWIQWQLAFKEHDIHTILGAEMYMVDNILEKNKGEKKHHITLLAKNEKGAEDLFKLLTVANDSGFYYKPRIDYDILMEHVSDLVVLTGCSSSFLNMQNGESILLDLNDTTDVFLEVMPHDIDFQKDMNKICYSLNKRHGIPLVASNDCHYIMPEESRIQEVLLAIQTKKKWKDVDRWRFKIDGLYLKSFKEMYDAFMKQAILGEEQILDALANTAGVAELCDLYIEKKEPYLPRVDVPKYRDKSEDEQLRLLSFDGLEELAEKHEYIRPRMAEYTERLEEELKLIIDLKFSRYFLIVWELIDWCKKNDILVGPGRGSSGGSLVCYSLGITAADPIKYKLLFSRFISEARIDLPDIDMDFEDIKRSQIRGHLEELYGKDNVGGLSNFMSLKGRSAVRDVARVFDVPLVDVNKAAKSIVVRSGGDFRSSFTIEDAFNTFEDGRKFKEKYPDVANISMALEGQVRGTGMHAAAMCVSAENLRGGKNCYIAQRSKEPLINWEKNDAEYMGLMKLDVLGLNALTILNECKKLIKERKDIDIDFYTIDLDDSTLYEEFTKGNSAGIFQFNSLGMMKLAGEIIVDDFEQLVALNALHRPGCLRSGMTLDYRLNKNGENKPTFVHPYIEQLTKDTHGIILYQEQIMHLMYDLGGLGWRTADTVRKVISKSKGEEQFLQFEQMFIQGCIDRGTLSEEDAKKVFNELRHFGSYGFNRSHAVEYSLIAAWMMHLKIYHPEEFIASWLTWGKSEERKADVFEEARRLGIKIILPDINISDDKAWVLNEDGHLVMPLIEIKGIGEKAASKILEIRSEGEFRNYDDFEARVPKRPVNKRVKEILSEAKAFEDMSVKSKLSEAELSDLSKLFPFELSNDPMYKYRKMVEKIGKVVKIRTIGSLNLEVNEFEYDYYFGRMTTVKFGYRGKVDQLEKMKEIEGTAESLGGVYGNFKDETDYVMLVFNAKLYNRRKDEIEHCEGKWFLATANHPMRTSSIICNDIWFADDLLNGEFGNLKLDFTAKPKYNNGFIDLIDEISDCEACELRGECTAPVLPSIGQKNVAIVGEAPGKNEDREGLPLIGDAGDVLWGGLGISRDKFHVTNVNKCWPRITRTPKTKHVKACSGFLDRELKAVEPSLILAMGNTCMKFFKDVESGIMKQVQQNATEWSNKYNCWICWTMHPASVLYNPENRELYDLGINNFLDKLEKIA